MRRGPYGPATTSWSPMTPRRTRSSSGDVGALSAPASRPAKALTRTTSCATGYGHPATRPLPGCTYFVARPSLLTATRTVRMDPLTGLGRLAALPAWLSAALDPDRVGAALAAR